MKSNNYSGLLFVMFLFSLPFLFVKKDDVEKNKGENNAVEISSAPVSEVQENTNRKDNDVNNKDSSKDNLTADFHEKAFRNAEKYIAITKYCDDVGLGVNGCPATPEWQSLQYDNNQFRASCDPAIGHEACNEIIASEMFSAMKKHGITIE